MWRTLTASLAGRRHRLLDRDLLDVALLVGGHGVGDRLVLEGLAEDLAGDRLAIRLFLQAGVPQLGQPGVVDGWPARPP